MPEKRVSVLAYSTVSRGSSGGTRHVDLFSRLDGWKARIFISDVNLHTRVRVKIDDGLIRTIPVLPYRNNGVARALNWLSYAFVGFLFGLRERVSVVYASSPHLFTGLAGWSLARCKRVPFVFEVRDLWPQVLADMGAMSERAILFRILRRIEHFLYRHATAVVILAEGSRQVVIAGGGDADRIVFIPNGADPEDFEPTEDRATLRARYGLSGRVFLYAGAHGPANGLSFLLDAAAELRDEYPDVNFILVGDGSHKKALMAEAHERGLDNIRFHDPVPKSEIRDLLAAADVGLHVLADVAVFRHGVSPNKVFDYLAAGKPVLSNCPGEVATIIEDAQAGVAVAPDALASGIRHMLDTSLAELHAWGKSGREFMATTWSSRERARRLSQLLEEVSAHEE